MTPLKSYLMISFAVGFRKNEILYIDKILPTYSPAQNDGYGMWIFQYWTSTSAIAELPAIS